MKDRRAPVSLSQVRGISLIEILVSVLVLAVGVLGIGALQLRTQSSFIESQQRSQAQQVLRDISERMNANISAADGYVTGVEQPIGVGDNRGSDCAAGDSVAANDLCFISQKLKGSSIASGEASKGAMVGARACVEEIQTRNNTLGVCLPGIYRVTVAWQGFSASVAPNQAIGCAAGMYGDESLRRVATSTVIWGTFACQ